jgi:TP901 family phage tail tape measure protein
MSGALRQLGAAALLNPITAIGAGVAVVGGAFVKAARQAEDFNRAMLNSQAIMANLTDTIDKDMRQAAFDVAKITQFSATEAAKAYFFLASAGLDASQSIKAMPTVAKFAQAGMFDLALATDLLTDAQSALGLTVDDSAQNMTNMKRVSDVLVKANTLANASVQQFSEALTNKAGAAMKVVGMDIEEGVAVLAAFADQGVKGAEAGTAFSIVLRELQKRAIDNRDAFRRFGIATFDVMGEVRPMAQIIGDLERALAGASDETKKMTLAQLGFQEKSIAYLQTILGTSEALDRYTEALRTAGGTTAEVADKQLTPFQKGWADLSANIGESAQNMSVLMDALGGLMKVGSKFMDVDAFEMLRDWYTFSKTASVFERFFDALSGVAQGPIFTEKTIRDSLLMQKTLEEMLAYRKELAEQAAETKALADATENVASAAKRAADTQQWKDVADIIGGLSEELGLLDRDPHSHALATLRGLGASDAAMRLARDTIDAIEAGHAAKELDSIISGLEREHQALTNTARELDLLEAGWAGANEEALAQINNLHDMIDAQRELAKQEREAKAAAGRHAKQADRITRFVEIDVSRTLVSGLTAARRQKQKVQDDEAVRLLGQVVRNTRTGGAAVVAPG